MFVFNLLFIGSCLAVVSAQQCGIAPIAYSKFYNLDKYNDHGSSLPPEQDTVYTVTKHELPFIALITFRGRNNEIVYCTGSIIASKYIMTIAHCVENAATALSYSISEALENGNVQVGSKSKYAGETFQIINYAKTNNPVVNIMILELDYEIRFDYVNTGPVCLGGRTPFRGETLIAGSQGVKLRSDGLPQENYLVSQLTVLYPETNEKVVFYRGLDEMTSNHGDSGGPVMMIEREHFIQIGVVSHGYPMEYLGERLLGLYSDLKYSCSFIEFATKGTAQCS